MKMIKKLFSKHDYLYEKIIFAIIWVVFFIYSLSLLYPLFWGFISSLKTPYEYYQNPFSFPEIIQWVNYSKALKELSVNDTSYFQMTFNSLWLTLGGTFISLFCGTITAYVPARYDFPGKRFIYGLNMFLMLVPIYGTMAAGYRLYSKYNLLNSPLFLLTYTGGLGGIGFLIMNSFFTGLPRDFSEAAEIDGAGHWYIFFRIMVPLASGPILVNMIGSFIGFWNDYLTPLLYFDSMPTLASGLYTFQQISVSRYGNYPVYFAGALISMLPILVMFVFCHRRMFNGMVTTGGLKG